MFAGNTRRFVACIQHKAHDISQLRGIRDGIIPARVIEKQRRSPMYKEREQEEEKSGETSPWSYFSILRRNPEFLPVQDWQYRDRITELVERQDMFRRRRHIKIPEFYVGSILAVTVADKFSPGKTSRFVGICIGKTGHGLRHNFILRNVIDNQGVEVLYDMYSPLIQQIEVLKLERRLDDQLYYLRDCPLEYSTFPDDMEPEIRVEGMDVPVNRVKVPLGPRPWSERWERANLKGVQKFNHLFTSRKGFEKNMNALKSPDIKRLWEKEDIIKHYRESHDFDTRMEVGRSITHDKKHWKKK